MRSRWSADLPLPFSRHRFNPGHFTVSAFVLSAQADAVLVVFHRKMRRWVQPGGHIEATDPDLLSAARREVAEETGLVDVEVMQSGLFDLNIHQVAARACEPAHQHFDLSFLFRSTGGGAVEGDGVSGVRWVPISKLSTFPDVGLFRAGQRLVTRW